MADQCQRCGTTERAVEHSTQLGVTLCGDCFVAQRASKILDELPEDGRPIEDRTREALRIAIANDKADRYWANHDPADATKAREPERAGGMSFFDLSELRRRLQGHRAEYLIDELWPEDAYGVLGAEDKAGKTWSICDLAVSVASDTPWIGRFDCKQGGVLLLFGEGGERNLLRRLDAIARGRGLALDEFSEQVRVSLAVPRLDNRAHLAAIGKELERSSPKVVLLDPLYLAAGGGRGKDLYAMGESLQAIQVICQQARAALVVCTHWNKGGEGTGPGRFTGVGPGAWGRVLGSAAVEQRHTDPDGRSTVTLLWEFAGGEIPETRFRMRRQVWVDDPSDLNSPMHYEAEITEEGLEAVPTDLSASQDRVLAALAGGRKTVQTIGDVLAKDGRGKPLKARTIQNALQALAEKRLVDGAAESGKAGEWWAQ